ncbi:Transmembrane protein 115 [Colletotrichum trifolii]|uniref:Transmembrane protein 115 n=1 Tax=Colletotrichum trifolii TaxID=5466 RepID=A0A4R8RS40_COLTR|nr:Transmembrane protein 115 [Colletotrichum trifolii]
MPPRINIPPVTRVLLAVLVLQSFLSAAIRYRQWSATSEIVIPYLTLIPQLSLIYPWTFLTSTLVENNIFTLGIALVTIHHGGRYLERAWSSAELAKFIAVTALIPNTLTFALMIVLFTLTRNERWTLTVIGGTIPMQISFLVAFSQLVPAHTVTLFRGILSLRVPRFPLLYLGVVLVLTLTPLLTTASFSLAVTGFLTSWTYLRFYKTVFPDLDASQSAALRGDASETFAFAEFFPGPVKPFVAALSTQIFEVLVAMRICSPFTPDNFQGGRSNNYIQRSVPGGARAEAERRRALALKTLDQRLHAATATNNAARSSPQPPAQQPTGPTVQTQPQPLTTQTAMTTQPAEMLGETNYTPEQDSSDKNGS